jgi:hypothetical protein
MSAPQQLAAQHNRLSEATFRLKSWLLMGRRHCQNIISRPRRFSPGRELAERPVVAISSSSLWNPDDNAQNWILTAGKIENLRIAARRFHGLEVPADTVFSFWRQLGNPNFGQGFVLGREIREGCVVPTIAGGLCQLSNALYDAALKADFTIVERHRHTRVIKGSLAEQDRDATVKWNYVDLRFKAPYAFRMEVELTADRLILTIKGRQEAAAINSNGPTQALPAAKLNDCYSCGNTSCFKHPQPVAAEPATARTTFLLDEKWDEYARYVRTKATAQDQVIVPLRAGRFTRANRYAWDLGGPNVRAVTRAALGRLAWLRLAGKLGRNIFAQTLGADRQVAAAASRCIPLESTHLVVAQALLPYLWEAGVLGGRTFDVLMSRLPMEILHQQLDAAYGQHAASKTLNDFRAPASVVAAESLALTRARRIITPHQEIARLFSHKAIQLDWELPAPPAWQPGAKILFPASALARKGAYEVRELARELQLALTVAGQATETADFWAEVAATPARGNPWAGVGLVLYPAYVEHQPRLLLKALAAGIPVVASTACGLAPAPNLTLVPAGNLEALRQAVSQHLALAAARQ